MSETADVVVAGAGHNALVAAAYLARAGYRCIVLDARPIPGGGAATEELLGPGYKIDTCSTGHTLIRTNPLLLHDELGLHAEYGLEYVDPDPVAHVAFPDGEHFTMWLDRERTCEEFARFSRRDADAYSRMLDEYDQVKSAFGAARFNPPGTVPPLQQLLADLPGGSKWQRRAAMSAWDVVRHEFEDPHTRAFMLWQAYQTAQAVDVPGTGALAYSIVFGRQQRSWSIPLGGSGTLTGALIRLLEAHGAEFHCEKKVASLVLEDGRCVGVETEDGERYLATRAVLSTIHVKHLVEMAPAEAWGEDFVYGVDTYDIGLPGFAVYMATTEPPVWDTPDGGRTAVSAGYAAWGEDIVRGGREARDGVFIPEVPWLLVATPTLVDPSRAPEGRHTVKFLSMQASRPPEGRDWAEEKEAHADRQLALVQRFCSNFTGDTILSRLVKSPEDIERTNPHMIGGTFHGGDRGIGQSGANRPVPGWGSYRMPIAGLYQTGGTTHPGGSITGAPGRNAASVMLSDLGSSLEEVVGAGGRAPAGSH